ncbi:MAG TPA: rhodanese-like domain-containing protein [Gemmatimonadales bacterium]|jgi:thiosulfate/3-mercaptopyruvate sulfurtransferase
MIAPIAALLALTISSPRDTMLVTADWLSRHLHDPKLVLLQVGPKDSFDSVHIAGAQYMSFQDFSAPRDSTRPALELPTPAMFDSVLQARGISDDSRIVIYSSDEWFSPTTRLYLTMVWAGLGSRTSILDGGLPGWRSARGATTNAVTTPRRGTLALHPRSDVIVSTDWVRSHLGTQGVALVDARDVPFFLGTWNGGFQQRGPQGHIPGAYNIPFGTVVDSAGKMLTQDQLTTLFQSVRAAPGDTVVTYCHVGQQGSLVWFAARLAGYEARLYDDSFTEWNKNPQNRVERF